MRNIVLNYLLIWHAWMRVIFTFLLVLSIATHTVFANKTITVSLQESKVITGVVTDATLGEALPGVSIIVKGTSTGTITDVEGHYTITASNTDILVFSFIGYIEEEILVGEQELINIIMAPDIFNLDEVVVIGYGVQKKKLVTGATTQVKSDDLVSNHSVRLESSLQGLTPGMVIVKESGQPGSDYNITIRGLASPNDNQPLVLIDGVPGNLNTLNPSDIETVDVLKDAASAAIYGSRGGSGVILITTKKGIAGKPVISYDFSYGISNATRKVPLLNAQEYATIMNEATYNTFPNAELPFTDEYIASLGEGTNWQEEAYNKNAPMQNHYLSFNGGNEASTYSISLSYDKEEGIFDYENKSQYERFGIRVNSEHKVNKHFTIGENITYMHRNTHALGTGNQYNNIIRELLEASPLLPVYDPNSYDGFARSENNPNGAAVPSDQQGNPIASMHYEHNDKNKYDDIIGDLYFNVEIIKGLNFRSDIGCTYNLFFQTTARDSFHLTPYTTDRANPFYRQKMERNVGYNWDNVLTYSKNFGDHSVLAMLGTNVQDNWYFNVEATAEGYLSNEAPVLSNVSTMVRDSVIGDFGKNDSRFSVFGRVSYDFKEKYLATVSIRRDGSSRFGKNYRYGIFPAASVGWVISEESFTESFIWLDFLKLRASWGQNGKEPFERYRYLATVSSTNRYYYFNGAYVGISPDIFPNPDLKWEAQEQINIGFDSRFLKDFSFTADWYRKTAKDWIIPVSVPGITGIAGIDELTDPYVNAGNVTNTGIELDMGFNKQMGDFFIGLKANMAYNKNKVTEVPGEIIHGHASVLYNGSDEFCRVQEGYPVGFFWGYKTGGIFQTQEEIESYVNEEGDLLYPYAQPGDVIRIDLNEDGILNDEDKTMIGDPNPDYVYGFTINTSYKGFDFSMNLQGQAGNQIVQCYRAMERSYPNYTTEILDRWIGEGTSNRIPRVTLGNESNQNWRQFSDLYIHDAGFLRVKSINVGYDFKSSLLKNTPLEQFRIYFSALNILTFTKYNGIDPEVGYGSYYNDEGVLTDGFASGIDMGFYPTAKTYLVGVNVKF